MTSPPAGMAGLPLATLELDLKNMVLTEAGSPALRGTLRQR